MSRQMKWQMSAGKIQSELKWLVSVPPSEIPAIRQPDHAFYERFDRIFGILYMAQDKKIDPDRIANAVCWKTEAGPGLLELTVRPN